MLSETRLRQDGYLHAKPVRERWMEHQTGQRNWQYHLWSVLMFQAWVREHSAARSSCLPSTESAQGDMAGYASEQELSQL
jgi:asparagine synthase (glutamine-hydrolysing)